MDLILQFHESKFEGGPNVTMFCTYKPKSCKLSELTKDKQARWVWHLGILAVAWVALYIHESRSIDQSKTISPLGMKDNQMYCIPNDWRSRDRKAEEFRTLTNCRFSLPMTLAETIPFGTMYCTYTQSYCTQLGHILDNEQIAWNIVKAIKNKEASIRTEKEQKILGKVHKIEEKAKKMKARGKEGSKRFLVSEIAEALSSKSIADFFTNFLG